MRHRVEIQENQGTTQDAFGAKTPVWVTVATRWASIEPTRGREYFDQNRQISETSYRVVLRYYAGLTTKFRLRFGARILNIEAILNPDELKWQMELTVKEEV